MIDTEAGWEFGEKFYDGLQKQKAELASKVPENIVEIEAALGDGLLSGEYDFMKCKNINNLGAFLHKKGIEVSEPLALLEVISLRQLTGEADFVGHKFKTMRSETLSKLERFKGRALPTQLAERDPSQYDHNDLMLIDRLAEQDALVAEGKTFAEVIVKCVYRDCQAANQAIQFLVEEKTGQKIDSPAKLVELAELDKHAEEFSEDDVHGTFFMGKEASLYAAVWSALRADNKWKDLLAIDPAKFDLPKKWKWTRFNKTQVDLMSVIHQAVFHYFNFGEQSMKPSVRDVAKHLEAPYEEILKASMHYDL